MKYTKLFSKGNIGKLEIKNRIVMPAMGVSLAGWNGEASPELIRYYEERAKGGCGLIITEITCIDEEHGKGCANQLTITSPKHIPGLERLAKAVHKYDAKIFVQLHHPGRETHSFLMDGRDIVAPSPIPCKVCQEMPRELTTGEVEELVKKFVTAAKIAQTAGIDGVELHGAHGYLIDQFMSPYTNKRTDKYGGDFTGRMRFITEIIMGIRAICGKDFPISVRISADEFIEGGIDLELGVKIAQYLEGLGIDAVNVSNGIYESGSTIVEPSSYPQGWKKHLAKTVKSSIKIPVIAVGVIRKPDFAENLLEEGIMDFAAIGRGHLADAEWSKKASEGREEEIRPCLSCRYCFAELGKGGTIKCTVNPRTGRELEFNGFDNTGNGRCVAIIGGGPAGMESARVLAIRGFKPVIFEKANELGGSLNLANKPLNKEKIDWLLNNLKHQIKLLNVEVRLNTEPTIEDIKLLDPYAVFVATGATPIIPNLPGVNGSHVYTPVDILTGQVSFKDETVAVIGSGMTGCETAELIAHAGNKVILVEMQDGMGKDIETANRFDIIGKLSKLNVEMLTSHKLNSIANGSIELVNVETEEIISKSATKVVLSLGVKPETKMADSLLESFDNVKVLGDAKRAGRITEAIREGFEKAYVL
ncbi:NAD(P)-binding protein [Clostridium bovifaecis]|uniref:NAD(P)-binding protein n=1 Tax=Clostridium bovifaecis TaxID=2184719 RepID=A0A6I6F0C2_9CLOT|nr:NAD(P)-binding protein [Clostridium bovifaecis]